MILHKAIIRRPAPEMIHGITASNLGLPDYDIAIKQHNKYIETLVDLDLEIMTLGPDPRYPDSVFVEDVAVVCKDFGLITRPGAVTRRGEVLEMEFVLHRFYKTMEYIYSPGFLDGGDVMLVGDHFYIGISERTNESGAEQLIQIAKKHGMTASRIYLRNQLHLKSSISYLDDGYLVIDERLPEEDWVNDFNLIKIPADESYAANCLFVNGTVLVAAGFPETEKRINDCGFRTAALDVSEFRKLDGGLTCLSLRL